MNNWKEIWKKRRIDFAAFNKMDTFSKFCMLKKIDGFEPMMAEEAYYKCFWNEWNNMYKYIVLEMNHKPIKSVFEVGCGSGADLFMFQNKLSDIDLGGIDYSNERVTIAKKVLNTNNIECGEALGLKTDKKYDIVLSDSVFQYFPDEQYGKTVLEKMFDKTNQGLVLLEIHDIEKKEECIQYRRSLCNDYDIRYYGLEKTFYSKSMFVEFAQERGSSIKITKVVNPFYWNSEYLFNVYIFKNKK